MMSSRVISEWDSEQSSRAFCEARKKPDVMKLESIVKLGSRKTKMGKMVNEIRSLFDRPYCTGPQETLLLGMKFVWGLIHI